MLENFFNTMKNPNTNGVSAAENSPAKDNCYKDCWNALKDKLIGFYSDVNIDDIVASGSTLTNEQIATLARWRMVSDIVNIMNSIEREHIK